MADTNYIAMGRAHENQSDTSRYINEFTRTRNVLESRTLLFQACPRYI